MARDLRDGDRVEILANAHTMSAGHVMAGFVGEVQIFEDGSVMVWLDDGRTVMDLGIQDVKLFEG